MTKGEIGKRKKIKQEREEECKELLRNKEWIMMKGKKEKRMKYQQLEKELQQKKERKKRRKE